MGVGQGARRDKSLQMARSSVEVVNLRVIWSLESGEVIELEFAGKAFIRRASDRPFTDEWGLFGIRLSTIRLARPVVVGHGHGVIAMGMKPLSQYYRKAVDRHKPPGLSSESRCHGENLGASKEIRIDHDPGGSPLGMSVCDIRDHDGRLFGRSSSDNRPILRDS